jgi:hypothetical protein
VDDQLCSVAFHGGEASLRVAFGSAADAIAAVRHWLEDRWSVGQLRSLASTMNAVSIEPLLTFDPD